MVKYSKNVNVCAPLYAGLVKNAARPEGQDLNPCLFLVRTNFLEEGDVVVVVVMVVVGGGGGLDKPGIFSAQRFCLYGQRTLQSLISPQQINTQAFVMNGPEQHASELILDTSDDSNYSFSAKPADSFHREKLEIWLLLA